MEFNKDIDNCLLTLEALDKQYSELYGKSSLTRTLAFETYNDNVVDAYMTKGGTEAYKVALEEINAGMIAALIAFFIAIAGAIARVFGGSRGGSAGSSSPYVVRTFTYSFSFDPIGGSSSEEISERIKTLAKNASFTKLPLFLAKLDYNYVKKAQDLVTRPVGPAILDLEHSLSEINTQFKASALNKARVIELTNQLLSEEDEKFFDSYIADSNIYPLLESGDDAMRNEIAKLTPSQLEKIVKDLSLQDRAIVQILENFNAINIRMKPRIKQIIDGAKDIEDNLGDREGNFESGDPLLLYSKRAQVAYRYVYKTVIASENFIDNLMSYLLKIRETYLATARAFKNTNCAEIEELCTELRTQIKERSRK